jgi:hypothetical protein
MTLSPRWLGTTGLTATPLGPASWHSAGGGVDRPGGWENRSRPHLVRVTSASRVETVAPECLYRRKTGG